MVCRALGVPTTEHSYEDGEILCRVSDLLGVPCAKHLVNVHLITRLSGVKPDRDSLTEVVRAVHQSKSFCAGEADFVDRLSSILPAEACRSLFILYSKHVKQNESADVVDLRPVLIDLFLLTRPLSAGNVLQFACQVYDVADKGSLTVSELRDVLQTVCHQTPSPLPSSNNHTFNYEEVRDIAASMSPKLANVLDAAAAAESSNSSTDANFNHRPPPSGGDSNHQARRAKAD
jgi:hypothetical protein